MNQSTKRTSSDRSTPSPTESNPSKKCKLPDTDECFQFNHEDIGLFLKAATGGLPKQTCVQLFLLKNDETTERSRVFYFIPEKSKQQQNEAEKCELRLRLNNSSQEGVKKVVFIQTPRRDFSDLITQFRLDTTIDVDHVSTSQYYRVVSGHPCPLPKLREAGVKCYLLHKWKLTAFLLWNETEKTEGQNKESGGIAPQNSAGPEAASQTAAWEEARGKGTQGEVKEGQDAGGHEVVTPEWWNKTYKCCQPYITKLLQKRGIEHINQQQDFKKLCARLKLSVNDDYYIQCFGGEERFQFNRGDFKLFLKDAAEARFVQTCVQLFLLKHDGTTERSRVFSFIDNPAENEVEAYDLMLHLYNSSQENVEKVVFIQTPEINCSDLIIKFRTDTKIDVDHVSTMMYHSDCHKRHLRQFREAGVKCYLLQRWRLTAFILWDKTHDQNTAGQETGDHNKESGVIAPQKSAGQNAASQTAAGEEFQGQGTHSEVNEGQDAGGHEVVTPEWWKETYECCQSYITKCLRKRGIEQTNQQQDFRELCACLKLQRTDDYVKKCFGGYNERFQFNPRDIEVFLKTDNGGVVNGTRVQLLLLRNDWTSERSRVFSFIHCPDNEVCELRLFLYNLYKGDVRKLVFIQTPGRDFSALITQFRRDTEINVDHVSTILYHTVKDHQGHHSEFRKVGVKCYLLQRWRLASFLLWNKTDGRNTIGQETGGQKTKPGGIAPENSAVQEAPGLTAAGHESQGQGTQGELNESQDAEGHEVVTLEWWRETCECCPPYITERLQKRGIEQTNQQQDFRELCTSLSLSVDDEHVKKCFEGERFQFNSADIELFLEAANDVWLDDTCVQLLLLKKDGTTERSRVFSFIDYPEYVNFNKNAAETEKLRLCLNISSQEDVKKLVFIQTPRRDFRALITQFRSDSTIDVDHVSTSMYYTKKQYHSDPLPELNKAGVKCYLLQRWRLTAFLLWNETGGGNTNGKESGCQNIKPGYTAPQNSAGQNALGQKAVGEESQGQGAHDDISKDQYAGGNEVVTPEWWKETYECCQPYITKRLQKRGIEQTNQQQDFRELCALLNLSIKDDYVEKCFGGDDERSKLNSKDIGLFLKSPANDGLDDTCVQLLLLKKKGMTERSRVFSFIDNSDSEEQNKAEQCDLRLCLNHLSKEDVKKVVFIQTPKTGFSGLINKFRTDTRIDVDHVSTSMYHTHYHTDHLPELSKAGVKCYLLRGWRLTAFLLWNENTNHHFTEVGTRGWWKETYQCYENYIKQDLPCICRTETLEQDFRELCAHLKLSVNDDYVKECFGVNFRKDYLEVFLKTFARVCEGGNGPKETVLQFVLVKEDGSRVRSFPIRNELGSHAEKIAFKQHLPFYDLSEVARIVFIQNYAPCGNCRTLTRAFMTENNISHIKFVCVSSYFRSDIATLNDLEGITGSPISSGSQWTAFLLWNDYAEEEYNQNEIPDWWTVDETNFGDFFSTLFKK